MKKIIIALIAVAAVAGGGYLIIANISSDNDKIADDKVSQTTSKTDNDSNNNQSAAVKDEELEGEIVSSFPDGKIPLYDGTVVSSKSTTAPLTGKPEWNVEMRTDDAIETIDASIRKSFSSNGWTIGSDMPQGNGFLLVSSNGDYTVTITYNDMFGPMLINYGVSSN